jgi:hypothetical protein
MMTDRESELYAMMAAMQTKAATPSIISEVETALAQSDELDAQMSRHTELLRYAEQPASIIDELEKSREEQTIAQVSAHIKSLSGKSRRYFIGAWALIATAFVCEIIVAIALITR